MSSHVRPMTKSQFEKDLRAQKESISRYLEVRHADAERLAHALREAAYRSFKDQQPHIWERKQARMVEMQDEILRCTHALLYIERLLHTEPEPEPEPEPAPSYPYDPENNTFAIPAQLWVKAERLLQELPMQEGQGEADAPSDQPQGNLDAPERRRVPALLKAGGRYA